jgi:hypothetical protein
MRNNLEEEVNNLDIKVKWILIIGAIVLIIVPIVVTQFDWFFNFTNTGQIGDTLGGTTAPVIGAVSALLIYFSFRAQINANRIIQNQIDDQKNEGVDRKNFEHQMERYKHLREHVADFTIHGYKKSVDSKKYVNLKGSNAINIFLYIESQEYLRGSPLHEDQHEYSQLRAILSFFTLTINHLKPIKDDDDSKFIFNLIEVLFYRHIWDRIENLVDKVLEEPNNPDIVLVQIFERIRGIQIELEKYKDIWPN